MSDTSTLITVSELTFAIKNQLESRFNSLSVQGEVTNAKLHSSGHFYFDLKDAEAKISAVMFRAQSQQLKKIPKEGDQVILKGGLTLYPPHGKYQMVVRSLEFMGVGELLLKLEALKKKLQEQGWFDKERKKPLPKFPRTIGVVTSPTGAVIRDIIHVLSRRFSGFHLILNPVRVQGAEAPQEIAKAIEDFNRYQLADVLIVGRGGGSLEDLWAFNEEIVLKAIFQSTIPIISAVGHETDVTLADFVADVRAPTPSAAAEIVSAEKKHHIDFLNKTAHTLRYAISRNLKQVSNQLGFYKKNPLFATPYSILASPLQKIDDLKAKLDTKITQDIFKKRYMLAAKKGELASLRPKAQVNLYKTKLKQFETRLKESVNYTLKLKKERLTQLLNQLRAVDPKNVLRRGYSILFAEKEGSVIVSAQVLTPGEQVRALLSDGEIKLTVNK